MFKIEIKKEQIITSIFIVACLCGYVFFPRSGSFQNKSVMIIFLILLPFLYCKYILKQDLISESVKLDDWKKDLKFFFIGIILAGIVAVLSYIFTDLSAHYFLSKNVKSDFWQFLTYELLGVSLVIFSYEIFFRGFVQRYFSKFFGASSILIQFLFFVMLEIGLLNGLPYWFYVLYLIWAPIGGWIFYKTQSIVYSFFGQLLFVIIFDATFIALAVK